ncbi:ABC transporter ATP-binding protein [Neobacillus mesonae]|uniref:ABC transporter ATP-binding protein n=1 Tax=Neobacillus mesonae TaxID=1193713 RepID=UPI00203E1EE5|nr:ABC transporter ATP-binding protein [Neobacillus mesonae]MCM3568584.1 ABC transporter ATP-binding protein [Neobacillus mesonae]
MSIVECRGLTKTFGGKMALNHFSCSIEENTITGLIGRNGAGKTTFLKILAGYFQQTSGEVRVFSERPFNNLTVSANVLFIHDQLNLPTALTLQEILDTMAGFYKNWDREFAQRLFEYFSFRPSQYHNDLSKGMKSTFNMILGLAARTSLTIFDEPTTGMDAAVRSDFYRALLKDYIAYPRTIILSSHHLEEIENLIEDILLIKEGRELLHIPIADLKEWAIGFQGKTHVVKEWTQGREIIFSKSDVPDYLYVVVKNDFTEVELEKAKVAGISISHVSSSNLCVYLTSKTKGGIDDVFNKG